jgi:hypothetical protein
MYRARVHPYAAAAGRGEGIGRNQSLETDRRGRRRKTTWNRKNRKNVVDAF